jgi:hypothetical protein
LDWIGLDSSKSNDALCFRCTHLQSHLIFAPLLITLSVNRPKLKTAPVPAASSQPVAAPAPTASSVPGSTPPPQSAIDDQRFACNICRDGGQLQRPNALLGTILGLPATCGQAQSLGVPGGIGYTVEQCAILQALAIGTCGCPFEPTPAPNATPQPTAAPVTVFCTVCFNGMPASGSGSIGGALCQELDAMGRNDEFTSEECLIIQTAAAVAEDDNCECMP